MSLAKGLFGAGASARERFPAPQSVATPARAGQELTELSDADFARVQKLLARTAGIRLGPTKRALVCGRLATRLRQLGLTDYRRYLDLVDADSSGSELATLLDRLTTNETHFFREARHFELLRQELRAKRWPHQPLRVWSAACSSGEEPYTLAMVLASELGADGWEILGSDINTQVLAHAQRGVYRVQRLKEIPEPFVKRYCLKGVRTQAGHFAMGSALRRNVRFRRVNLHETLPDVGQFDIIFLRNVMIYFDDTVKRQVVQRLTERLRPGGYFFIGHSETLNGLSTELASVHTTVYRKP